MSPKNQRLVRGGVKILIIALILGPLVVDFVGGALEAFNVHSEVVSGKTWARFFQAAFWYQTTVKAGNRRPRAHYVRLVTLVKGREPDEIFQNMCRQRVFMAKLLTRIEEARPALIVVDKFYSLHSCESADDPGNKEFLQALRSSEVPVVLGLKSSDSEELEAQQLSDEERKALRGADLVLEPTFPFSAENVRYGLIRGDRDTRKIPLQWMVFDTRSDLAAHKKPHLSPTVPRLAAEIFDASSVATPNMKDYLSRRIHPYTSFLSEREFPTFSASELVCEPVLKPGDSNWADCRSGALGNDLLRNHIVVIGNRTIEDFHASVVGIVPGMVLQANYIESLLDDRYFAPVPWWLGIAINFVVALVIIGLFFRAIFSKSKAVSPDAALVGSVVLILLGWMLVYLLVLHLGYYLSIWFPGVVALLVMWAHERAHERAQEAPTDQQTVAGQAA